MMRLEPNKLIIEKIPNSEFYKRNSLIEYKVKSDVKEFYITKKSYEDIITFLSLSANNSINVKIDTLKMDEYLSIMDEQIQTYEFLYHDGFCQFYESLAKLKSNDSYLVESITITLSKSGKYLSIPKRNNEKNSIFSVYFIVASQICVFIRMIKVTIMLIHLFLKIGMIK